ncbi:hypothetical protein ROHU_029745 [Labeo rohita]|uniref:Uncharacterized protein n=1 Tax=Labeo rohita TaxID=84645 RepID=A0A498LXF7_LABRO|nr:hypothetical protein ROHU_029745 [Labeo rohita]
MRAWAELRQRSGNHLVTSPPLARKRSQWRFGPGGRRDDGDGLPTAKGLGWGVVIGRETRRAQNGATVRVSEPAAKRPVVHQPGPLLRMTSPSTETRPERCQEKESLPQTARVADGGLSWWGHLAVNLGLLRNRELPSPQSTESKSTLPKSMMTLIGQTR